MKFRPLFSLLLLAGALAIPRPAAAQAQSASEVETKEAPAQFTSRVNLVPVTVVVRDRNGHAVGNLTKEDFRLLDNGKPQVIAKFSIEKPNAPVVLEKEAGDLDPDAKPSESDSGSATAAPIADHFVAYLFDDVHARFEDLVRARDGAAQVIAASMKPADRAAIYTTSGQVIQEFTGDKAKLQDTLARLRPAPVSSGPGHGLDCPDISYFLADRIVNIDDPQALQVALLNYQACSGNQYATGSEVQMYAQRALHDGEHETRLAASVLLQVVRRLAGMPGQRSIVLASPGFLVPFADQSDVTDVINRHGGHHGRSIHGPGATSQRVCDGRSGACHWRRVVSRQQRPGGRIPPAGCRTGIHLRAGFHAGELEIGRQVS
jgi:VWFA-related protein